MIGNTADSKRLHFVCPCYSAHIRPKPRLQFLGNSGNAVLGCKHIMKQQAGMCVIGHTVNFLKILSQGIMALFGCDGRPQSSLAGLGLAGHRYPAVPAGLLSDAPDGACALFSVFFASRGILISRLRGQGDPETAGRQGSPAARLAGYSQARLAALIQRYPIPLVRVHPRDPR
jgi:hypothetical protein